jgi:prepilin-type N-terminal cleavage/methylation domain-containing protein
MRRTGEKGFTLVEVILAVGIMGIIATGAIALVSSYLDTHAYATAKSGLYREGLMAMERMTDSVRRCTYLLIPNAHSPTRDILAVSGFVNDDNDFYFNDPLFPRIDEDPKTKMTDDGASGIAGLDDDGDSLTDESGADDDDEDGADNEDPLDGIDNDGDGNIDEDGGDDGDIPSMDDDGDGTVDVDAADIRDQDEDGVHNEDGLDPLIYSWNSATSTLTSSMPNAGASVDLSTHVTLFQVTYEAPDRILIALTLTGDDGESLTFKEYVCPRNTFQKIGKRVR